MTRRLAKAVVVTALVVVLPGCGGGSSLSVPEPDPPVGEALIPDLAPAPPQDVQTSLEDGRWYIRFSTILVNIGEGDFVLRAQRGIRDWTVYQDVQHAKGGATVYPTDAPLVWGGDGHDHWHVERVAVNRLVRLDSSGKPPEGAVGLADSKIGFCFYDYSRWLETGPVNEVYRRVSCGSADDTAIGVGLSVGWADIYHRAYVGQTVDITDVPDGRYRLWSEVDPKGWFREARRDNNVTWVDFELVTRPNGAREVRDVVSGPPIRL